MASATWSIPARPEEVPRLRRAAVEFAQSRGVSDPLLSDLRLAISEGLSNAVLHAYRDQSPGTVTVAVEVRRGEMIEIVVRDDGSGMSKRSDSPGMGLGLSLISSIADQVEQRTPTEGEGFELWMGFRLDGS